MGFAGMGKGRGTRWKQGSRSKLSFHLARGDHACCIGNVWPTDRPGMVETCAYRSMEEGRCVGKGLSCIRPTGIQGFN
jgi:hypothetical protein